MEGPEGQVFLVWGLRRAPSVEGRAPAWRSIDREREAGNHQRLEGQSAPRYSASVPVRPWTNDDKSSARASGGVR